jgi:hypothetical protein
MLINRNKIFYEKERIIDQEIFKYVVGKLKSVYVCIVEEWFGSKCKNLVSVLPDQFGIPVAIFKIYNE